MLTAALIAAFACPAQPAVLVDRPPGEVRTTVVACHRGRRVVVRRARLRLRPRSGRKITAVSGAGRRVAWAEARHAGARLRGRVYVSRIARGRARIVHRRLVLDRSRLARNETLGLDVVLTSRGELAWIADWRVFAARIHGRARIVARDSDIGLALEDDRTLRWWTALERPRLRFLDLRRWPRGRCPDRRRFRLVAASADVTVTRAEYGNLFFDESVDVFRACERATGADRIVLETSSQTGLGDRTRVIGVSGPWIAFRRETHSDLGCQFLSVDAVHGLTGAAGRSATRVECVPTDPGVVTDRGIPAWITSTTERSAVQAAGPDGVIELDAGGPGAITGLVAEGTRVRWLNAGEPRSADVE